MSAVKWVVGNPDREKAKLLAAECDIDPFAALVAVGRGIDNEGELELLMSEEPILCDPLELADIRKAADYINTAIRDGVKMAIFGDYDCDGVVATSLLYDYLIGRGADVIAYIPDRFDEGYGMNCAAVDSLAKQGVELIITVDNGISCAKEIAYANSLNIKTIVTDHHLLPPVLPDAIAIVNPHREDCASSFKEICGAEVAFKLVCVLDDKEPEEMLSRYADILAVAVIGDSMPLVNENRSIVKAGIRKIKSSSNVGISAILNIAGMDKNTIDSGSISFGITPRINAAGRMGSPYRAFEALTAKTVKEALAIVGPIDDDNTRRKQIEKDIFKSAAETIEKEKYYHNRVIVVCGKGWHFGVVGIVASRISEMYGKPAVVLSSDNGIAHGSGRSMAGFNLTEALRYCSDILVKYGGHEMAAGASVSEENVDLFREKINEYAASVPVIIPTMNIDFKLNPAGMSVDMAFALKSLEPFGMGNPSPVFGIFDAIIEKVVEVGGGKHLKLLCRKNGNAFQAVYFGMTQQQFCFAPGDKIDLAVTLDINYYQERYNLSIKIKDVKLSDIDQDKYFSEKIKYDDFMAGNDTDFASIFPERSEVISVYKNIVLSPQKKARLQEFCAEVGYAKTQIAITALLEMGIVVENNGILISDNDAPKSNLMNSGIYKKLYERVNGCE